MVTVDQIMAFFEREVAERHMAGDREGLRQAQLALGLLMRAADDANDRSSAAGFRNLAARAANYQDQIAGKD